MRKKRFRLLLYAGLAVFVLVAITTSFVRAARTEYTTMEAVVHEGDTLWSIWEDVGYGRFDEWHCKVRELNDKDLSVLQPYDRVTVSTIER